MTQIPIQLTVQDDTRAGFAKFDQRIRDIEQRFKRLETAGEQSMDGISKATDRVDTSFRGMGSRAQTEFGSIESAADQARKSIMEIEPAAERAGEAAAGSITSALGGIQVGDVGSSLVSQFGSIFAVAGPIGAVITAASLVWGDVIARNITGRIGSRKQDITNAVRSGLPLTEARAIGASAGQAYARGWGDSMKELASEITDVASLLDTVSADGFLDEISTQVVQVAEGLRLDSVRLGQSIKSGVILGFADTPDEMLDIMIPALQAAGPHAEEVLEIFNEYAPAFRRAGIAGDEAMTIIAAGLEQGIFAGDKVADSIKELGLALETTEGRAAALALKLDPDELAGGGEQAYKAVITALLGVDDATKRAEYTTALFATTLEDVSLERLIVDLVRYATITDEAGGSTEELINDFEKARRGIDPFVSEVDRLAEAIARQGFAWEAAEQAAEPFNSAMSAMRDVSRELAESILNADEARAGTLRSLYDSAVAANEAEASFAALTDATGDLTAEFERMANRFDGAQAIRAVAEDVERLAEVAAAAEGPILNLDGSFNSSNASARDLESQLERVAGSLLAVAEGYAEGTVTASQMTAAQDTARAAIRAAGEAAGLTAADIQRLVDKYGTVPPQVVTEIMANTAEAWADVTQFGRHADTTAGKARTARINVTTSGLASIDRAITYAARNRTSYITSKYRITGQIPSYARDSGGTTGAQTVNFGERRPEIVDTPSGGSILADPSGVVAQLPPGSRIRSGSETGTILNSGGGSSGGGTIIVNVHGSVISERELEGLVSKHVRTGSADGFGGVF